MQQLNSEAAPHYIPSGYQIGRQIYASATS